MKTTRITAVAVLTMGSTVALCIAQQARAQAQAPGITRTDLQRHDLTVPGRQVVQMHVARAPGVLPLRHRHPGVATLVILTISGARLALV